MFFEDYFKVFRTIHNTRSSRTCSSPKSELRRQGSLLKLSNNIPSEMKDFKSVVIFKTRILELYRSKACYLLVKFLSI